MRKSPDQTLLPFSCQPSHPHLCCWLPQEEVTIFPCPFFPTFGSPCLSGSPLPESGEFVWFNLASSSQPQPWGGFCSTKSCAASLLNFCHPAGDRFLQGNKEKENV